MPLKVENYIPVIQNARGYYSNYPIYASVYSSAARAATFVVAAYNASATSIAQADYVCDGTSDDVQIQAALNALPPVVGGSVRLTEGNFSISATVTMPASPFALFGSGITTTLVSLASGANTNMFSYTAATSITFSSIRDFTLDGNQSNNTSGLGININSSGNRWDFYFRDLLFNNFYSQAFYAKDGHDYVFDHVIVENTGQASAPGTAAMLIDTAGDNAWFNNCLIKSNAALGLKVGGYTNSITSCHFDNNGGVGLEINGKNNTVVGNTFDYNGQISSNSYSDLRITINGINTVVVGNNFFNSTGGTQVNYNIVIDSAANGNVISGNYFAGYVTSPVSDSGTGTIYSGNNGVAGYVAKTTTYPIVPTDNIIDCTSGTFTVTLPTSIGSIGKQYTIKNSGAGTITLATTSSQTIDGATTISIATQYEAVTVCSDGANWKVINQVATSIL